MQFLGSFLFVDFLFFVRYSMYVYHPYNLPFIFQSRRLFYWVIISFAISYTPTQKILAKESHFCHNALYRVLTEYYMSFKGNFRLPKYKWSSNSKAYVSFKGNFPTKLEFRLPKYK